MSTVSLHYSVGVRVSLFFVSREARTTSVKCSKSPNQLMDKKIFVKVTLLKVLLLNNYSF